MGDTFGSMGNLFLQSDHCSPWLVFPEAKVSTSFSPPQNGHFSISGCPGFIAISIPDTCRAQLLILFLLLCISYFSNQSIAIEASDPLKKFPIHYSQFTKTLRLALSLSLVPHFPLSIFNFPLSTFNFQFSIFNFSLPLTPLGPRTSPSAIVNVKVNVKVSVSAIPPSLAYRNLLRV